MNHISSDIWTYLTVILHFYLKATLKLADIFLVNVILQIAASSNGVFLKNQDSDGQSLVLLKLSNIEKAEKEPLLLQYGTQGSS